MDHRLIDRFKQLPQIKDEVWQGGIVRLPSWVRGKNGAKPFRPWCGLWISLKAGRLNMTKAVPPEQVSPDLAIAGLLVNEPGQGMVGYRPGKLVVTDPELGQYLRHALAGANVEIEVTRDQSILKAVLADMAQALAGTEMPPGMLSGQSVTPDRVRAFAEAAAHFYRAAPWQYLTDEDLLHIESPRPPDHLKFATVMGAGGMTYGLGFYRSRQQFMRMRQAGDADRFFDKEGMVWSAMFGQISELPFDDADLFEDQALPVADDQAYPFPSGVNVKNVRFRRPNATELSFLEGLMRALAHSTEDEIDRGRWTKPVPTADGPMEFTLALPDLLEALEGKKSHPSADLLTQGRRFMEKAMRRMFQAAEEKGLQSPEEISRFLNEEFSEVDLEKPASQTPLDQAQDLVDQAYEVVGRRKIQLARQAIALCPDCADAYVLLAERTADRAKACDLYRQAMAAAERALGPQVFDEAAGHFWSLIETRPYMRARLGLANCLREAGQVAQAAEHYRAMLQLNPGDNQGIRYILAPTLFELKRDAELDALLKEFADDASPMLLYVQALATFRREGDSPLARQHIAAALKANRHVRKYLTAQSELPPFSPPMYSPGSDEEAMLCAQDQIDLWEQTPGALDWLDAQRAPAARRKSTPKPKAKGKGRKKK